MTPLPKLSPEFKQEVRFAVRHPITWWKGEDLPEEQLRPWEGGIHFAQAVFNGFQVGFTNMRGRIFVGGEPGLISPIMNSGAEVVGATFDALTDPPIGVHMDQRQYDVGILRKLIRFHATYDPLTLMLTLFSFGLSPWARVATWVFVGMTHSITRTASEVSAAKIWAGITPHTEQRGKVQLWRSIGETIGAVFSGMPNIFMGLRHVLGVNDYQIMVIGALVFLPITIFGRWLPSYAKQRVDFNQKVDAVGEENTHAEKLTFRETFAVVKHNRWFMVWLVIGLARIITPRGDQMFIYRFLIREMPFTIFGQPIGAELLFTLKDIVFGLPGFLMTPFALQAVKLFGGPLNFLRTHVAVIGLTHLFSFLVGWQSLPRLVFMWTMEGIRGFFNQWAAVPHNIIEYEMFDYVEWKTGHRSEGLTQSVYGIINKLVRNNLTSIVGGLVVQWTGFRGWVFDNPEDQPQRFLDTIWPLAHVGIVVAELFAFIGLMWFKYPRDPGEVERDLIERRALVAAQQELREEHDLNV
ncbi:MAG: MFS transporter [Oscillospiraceae bacterium]|nr:MFS transporter [Oscillospiraceae bacterium]